MAGTKISIIDKSFAQQTQWWAELVAHYADWYLLRAPAGDLLTNYYAELIMDGHVPANKWVKLAVERHLKDLKRQGDDDFPWVFNEDAGWRPIRFIEDNIGSATSEGGGKIVVQPFQHFIIGSLFGWVHKDTGVRRFTEGTIFLARKNGKRFAV